MGNTYITGQNSHWRKLERESKRDIFLDELNTDVKFRDYRQMVHHKCENYLDKAGMRNRHATHELKHLQVIRKTVVRKMSAESGRAYLAGMSGIPTADRGFGLTHNQFDPAVGADFRKLLKVNAGLPERGKALCDTVTSILEREPGTKILVFVDGSLDAGDRAREFLEAEKIACDWLDTLNDSNQEQNEKIGRFSTVDTTEEEKARPRVLILNFEHAAGLNLQAACHDLIFFTPLYSGLGLQGDQVGDCSTELQAIGRIHRIGQTSDVRIWRLTVHGPDGEANADGTVDVTLTARTTDKETVKMATNSD